MVKTTNSVGDGAVLPSREKLTIELGIATISILQVVPENGYDSEGTARPHDNLMVLVQYPEGEVKEHQCKDIDDLMVKITSFINRKFEVSDFVILKRLALLEAGQTLNVEIR